MHVTKKPKIGGGPPAQNIDFRTFLLPYLESTAPKTPINWYHFIYFTHGPELENYIFPKKIKSSTALGYLEILKFFKNEICSFIYIQNGIEWAPGRRPSEKCLKKRSPYQYILRKNWFVCIRSGHVTRSVQKCEILKSPIFCKFGLCLR